MGRPRGAEAVASSGQLMHLRLVVPAPRTAETLELLQVASGTCNVICVPGAAIRPAGDLVLCDVAREVASDLLEGLRGLGLHEAGSITVERVELQLSAGAVEAERAAPGRPGNAVVWEQVEAETSEAVELSASFMAFMIIAALIAMVGIFQDSPILIVGAMVVGPEFGPLAGICVALVEGRRRLALALAPRPGGGLPGGDPRPPTSCRSSCASPTSPRRASARGATRSPRSSRAPTSTPSSSRSAPAWRG